MKKFLLLFLAVSLNASAEYVFLFPSCRFNQAYGECRLWNTSGKEVACNFNTRGQTMSGSTIYLPQYVFLYQGMFASASVRANNPALDPITFLTANANCNTFGR